MSAKGGKGLEMAGKIKKVCNFSLRRLDLLEYNNDGLSCRMITPNKEALSALWCFESKTD